MRVLFRIALFSLFFTALAAVATPPPGYYEVWGDEFNGTSLDPAKWWVWNQPDRSGYTTPNAVTVSNGCMTILTYSTNGQNYAGIVSSDGRFRARYGYSEASVEFNGSPGMFSDFWINSANNGQFIGDPAAEGAEVDICEHRVTDANDADNISGNVTIDLHWDGYKSGIEKSFNSPLYGSGLGAGFHTYGLLWSPTNYNASIDGVPTMITNVGVSQRTEIILFSCEVDSNSFCGIVPTGGYGNFNVSTTSTVVDYFRFYAPTTTVYWIGSSSANWTDGGNWLSNMIPTAASDVVFSYLSTGNYSVNLGQNIAVNSLSLQETPGISISGSALTINGGGIDMLSAINGATINSPVVLGAAQAWTTGSGIPLVVNGPVSGAGNLTLNGLGTVAFEAPNTSTGTTTISNGGLYVYGSMSGPVTVAGGTLLNNGTLGGAVTVNSGIFTGAGAVTAPVAVNAGGTIEPGSPTGALTVNNSLTLAPGSFTVVNINKSAGTNGLITGVTSANLGGVLLVSNLSTALAPGDSFTFLQAGSYTGSFSEIIPVQPGPGLVWDTSALATGTLHVISTSNSTVAAQLAGHQVTLSWPANNLGWLLQTQTNPPGKGITTNWMTVPGSSLTNLMNIPLNTNVGSVFYRLASPSFSTAVFGSGDLIVLQVGNGAIATSGAPGVLEDFPVFGGPSLNTIALPASGTNALIFGGSSYDGEMSLSGDGKSIVIPGYNVPAGYITSAIDSSSTTGASAVPRAVGLVRANGAFAIAATTTQFSGSTIRGATADGAGNFWAGGGSSGIVYLGGNAPAATLSTISSATRELAFVNGNLCFAETGSGYGIMSFSGAPMASSTPTLLLNSGGLGNGGGSPVDFAFSPTIAYVADNRTNTTGGGVLRYNWNGSSWVYAYTLVNNATSSKEVDAMVVNFNGAHPVIYAVTGEATGNSLVTVTDTGSSSSFSVLDTAASGDAFRGLVFAPSGN